MAKAAPSTPRCARVTWGLICKDSFAGGGLGWAPRVCTLNMLPGDMEAAGSLRSRTLERMIALLELTFSKAAAPGNSPAPPEKNRCRVDFSPLLVVGCQPRKQHQALLEGAGAGKAGRDFHLRHTQYTQGSFWGGGAATCDWQLPLSPCPASQ